MRRFTLISMLLIVALMLGLAACGGTSTGSEAGQTEESEHAEEAEHSHEHADEHDEGAALPNNGAVVRIIAPQDGATFKTTDEILIQVEVENFALGEDGNHWHVHLDDASEIMVMGGNTDQPLRNLTPGEHTIEVMLSNGDHQNLEEGDSITITVEE